MNNKALHFVLLNNFFLILRKKVQNPNSLLPDFCLPPDHENAQLRVNILLLSNTNSMTTKNSSKRSMTVEFSQVKGLGYIDRTVP